MYRANTYVEKYRVFIIMIYPDDFINKIICGNCFDVIQDIPDDSIDVVVTSPPYWAKRKYINDDNQEEIGQEPYFMDYVDRLGRFFVLVGKKIKPEGSLWINIDDTYYGGMKGVGGKSSKQLTNKGSFFDYNFGGSFNNKELPNKSLCNIPARLSVFIQDSGFILRNVIIWHKPNAWVTSAKDRFTVDFEYLFWFVKQPKYYFVQQFEPYLAKMNRWGGETLVAKSKSVWDKTTGQSSYRTRNMRPNKKGRNKRTVWSINTKPIKGLSHCAKFPDDLIRIPILATCPPSGVVLDPFMGSGTTALFCKQNNIDFIGVDISQEYVDMAIQRLEHMI